MSFLIILLFISTASSYTLRCNFVYIEFEFLGNIYTCYSIAFEYNGPAGAGLKVTKVIGDHISGHSLANVQAVHFSQNEIYTVPKGLTAHFPNLVALYFYNCDNLKRLEGNELEEYPKLKFFQNFYSNVKRVPGNFFSKNPEMIFTRWHLSDIVQVGENLTDFSKNWKGVHFDKNACVDASAKSLEELPGLKAKLKEKCPDRCYAKTVENFVCDLNGNLENLDVKVEDFQGEISNLDEKYKAKVQNLEAKVAELTAQNQAINDKLEAQAATLIELEKIILELTSRPCF